VKKPQDICFLSLIQQLKKENDKEPTQNKVSAPNEESVKKE
jgi:hypothetical protein